MLAFSLTTLAQIGPSPPAPSGTPCTPSTSCKHSCGAYTFDLSGFNAQMKSMGNSDQPPHPDYYKTNDGDTAGNHDYYFGPCVALTSAVSCDGSIATAPVAIQTWQDGVTPPFPSDSCGALGDYSTQQCTASSATSLQCTYSGGDQSRQVTFIYTEGPLAPPAAQETQYPQYTVTFTGPLTGSDYESTCGPDSPSKVADCGKIDFGSCGGACCIVDVPIQGADGVNTTDHTYQTIKKYLQGGGEDGSYTYVTGPDAAGHNPGDDLTAYPIAWDYIFQGQHTSSGGYVDTMKFNLKRPSTPDGSTTLRVFSVSDVHGALGDNGQNYKNIAYLVEGRRMTIVHGCGA